MAGTEHKAEVNMYRRSFNFTILQLTVLIFVTKTCKFEQFPLTIIYKSTGTLAELFNYTTCHLLHPWLCAQLTIRRVSAGEIKWVLRSFLHKFYNFPRVISFKISSLRWNSLAVATLISPAILTCVWFAWALNSWKGKKMITKLAVGCVMPQPRTWKNNLKFIGPINFSFDF